MLSDIRFGDVVVLRDRRRILIGGREAALGSRAFDVLVHLIEHRDRFVGKEELLEAVWGMEAVEDGNLHVHVHALRRLLGRDVIAGVRGRGYRFTALLNGRREDLPAVPVRMAVATVPDRLYGRDADLQRLDPLARSHRLLTLVGPGGVGKTRLARALVGKLAGSAREEVCWIDLSVVDSPQQCLGAMAQALLLSSQQPWTAQSLAARIQAMDGWVVLDNCEHVLGAVAELVTALLAQPTRVSLIATSRRSLGMSYECKFRVSPLALPPAALTEETPGRWDAVELLLGRARLACPEFRLAPDEMADVHELTRRLDGLPLAIELAAARLTVIGVKAMLRQLDTGLSGLSTSRPAVSDRHRTMTAVVNWSYQLLGAQEQALLRRLAVFAGPFTLDQAAALASDGAAEEPIFVDRLQDLVQHMLVLRQPGPVARWRLLETTRHFARDRLQDAGEFQSLRRAHVAVVIQSMRAIDAAYFSGARSEQALRDAAEELLPELLAALATCDDASELQVMGFELFALGARFLFWGGHAGALQPWADRAAACAGLPAGLEAAVRLAWCHVPPASLADPLAQTVSLQRACALFVARGDRIRAMHAHAWLALRLGDSGRLLEAGGALAAATAIERPSDPARIRAWRLHVAAVLAQMRGGSHIDLVMLDEVRDDLNAAGDGDGRTFHMLTMDGAQAHLLHREFAEAQRRLQALLDQASHQRLDCVRMTWLLGYLALAELGLERTERAAERLRQCLLAARRADLLHAIADVLAWCLALEGRYRAAVELIGAVHGRLKRRGVSVDAVLVLTSDAVHKLTEPACSDEDRRRWTAAGAAWSDADLRRMLSGFDRRYVP